MRGIVVHRPRRRLVSGYRFSPRAANLGIESVATASLCRPALLRSVAAGIPAYDTLFVELAARAGCPLVTFDKAVLKAFPEIAIRPRQLAED